MLINSINHIHEKYNLLIDNLKHLKKISIAYSGGVDSTLLLFASLEAVGKQNVLAIIIKTQAMPEKEINDAVNISTKLRINFEIIELDIIKIINENNDNDRCYFCKKSLFSNIIKISNAKGFNIICEGTNIDDLSDFRPGIKALKELNILSPLLDVKLTKDEIRKLSRFFDLPTWDKPSSPCLITRFPYRTIITEEAINKIYKAETYLHSLGFKICRVRHFDKKAIIEVPNEEIRELIKLKNKVNNVFNELGYNEIIIDQNGYKPGKMNERIYK